MFRNHGVGKTTALNIHGKYQIHTKYADDVERIEEWVVTPKQNEDDTTTITRNTTKSNENITLKLVTRKWKSKKIVGFSNSQRQEWDFEIGRQSNQLTFEKGNGSTILKSSTEANPSFHAEDSESHFIWIVENCPWTPIQNYSLKVDEKAQSVALKTENKKYYKVFHIPAMSRSNLRLNAKDVEEFQLKYNSEKKVLTISLEKPEAILKHERTEAKARDEAIRNLQKDGDVNCRQS